MIQNEDPKRHYCNKALLSLVVEPYRRVRICTLSQMLHIIRTPRSLVVAGGVEIDLGQD